LVVLFSLWLPFLDFFVGDTIHSLTNSLLLLTDGDLKLFGIFVIMISELLVFAGIFVIIISEWLVFAGIFVIIISELLVFALGFCSVVVSPVDLLF